MFQIADDFKYFDGSYPSLFVQDLTTVQIIRLLKFKVWAQRQLYAPNRKFVDMEHLLDREMESFRNYTMEVLSIVLSPTYMMTTAGLFLTSRLGSQLSFRTAAMIWTLNA